MAYQGLDFGTGLANLGQILAQGYRDKIALEKEARDYQLKRDQMEALNNYRTGLVGARAGTGLIPIPPGLLKDGETAEDIGGYVDDDGVGYGPKQTVDFMARQTRAQTIANGMKERVGITESGKDRRDAEQRNLDKQRLYLDSVKTGLGQANKLQPNRMETLFDSEKAAQKDQLSSTLVQNYLNQLNGAQQQLAPGAPPSQPMAPQSMAPQPSLRHNEVVPQNPSTPFRGTLPTGAPPPINPTAPNPGMPPPPKGYSPDTEALINDYMQKHRVSRNVAVSNVTNYILQNGGSL